MKRTNLVLLIAIIFIISISFLAAEVIYLKNGRRVYGDIIFQDAGTIKVARGEEIIIFFRSEIKHIGKPVKTAPKKEEKKTGKTNQITIKIKKDLPFTIDNTGGIADALKTFENPQIPWDKKNTVSNKIATKKDVVKELGNALIHPGCPQVLSFWLIHTLKKINTLDAHKQLYRYVKANREKSHTMAIRALSAYRHKAVLKLLLSLMNSKNVGIQLAAMDALAHLKSSLAIAPLADMLDHKKIPIKIRAERALITMVKDPAFADKAGIILLKKLAKIRTTWARKKLIELIGLSDFKRSVPFLLRLLDREELYDSLILTLGRLGGREAITTLIQELRKDFGIAEQKKDVLIKAIGFLSIKQQPNDYVEDLIAMLQDPKQEIRKESLATLIKCTGKNYRNNLQGWNNWWQERGSQMEKRRRKLLDMLVEPENQQEFNLAIIWLYDKANEDILTQKTIEQITNILIEKLELEEKSENIQLVIKTMGHLKHPKSQTLLSELLLDNKVEIRIAAMESLSNYPVEKIQRIFVNALNDEEEPRVRALLYEICGQLRIEKALPHLLEDLEKVENIQPEVRAAAARALSYYEDNEQHIRLLIDLLKSNEPMVKAAAYHSLFAITNQNLAPEFSEWIRYWSEKENEE